MYFGNYGIYFTRILTGSFSELVFSRESCSGHSESAYFIGKVLSTFFRIFLSALHFTSFYMVLTASIVPFHVQLGINILYFYCQLIQVVSFLENSTDIECFCKSRYLRSRLCRRCCHIPTRWASYDHAYKPYYVCTGRLWSSACDCAELESQVVLVLVAWCKLMLAICTDLAFTFCSR